MSSVDVVVPCYNYARFLKRCVESVLTQRGPTIRVLIIDDSSTDDTPVVAREIALDPRVEYRRHDVNQGHIATYNEGLLGWASADYSVLLSADDALTPGALGRAVDLLDRQPEVGVACGRALIVGNDAQLEAPVDDARGDYRVISGEAFLMRCCAFSNPVATPTAVVRTAWQHRLGGYRANLPHSGDMEMWMRFATQGPVGILSTFQAYYRWHGGNMGTAYYDAALGDLKEQKAACHEVLTTWGASLPDAEGLLRAVSQRVAQGALRLASAAFDAGDLARSRECLQFAKQQFPEVEQSPLWKRLRAKEILGLGVWRKIRPGVNWVRGLPDTTATPGPQHFRVGGATGWWPGQGD